MSFISTNPYSGTAIETISEHTSEEIDTILRNADQSFALWRQTTFGQRAQILTNVAAILLEHIEKYARIISIEMGKPIRESRAEIKKCALVCNYYAAHAEEFMKAETIETDAEESYVSLEPMGCILAIMPWNFPFWQVFRFAAPTLMAGNVCLVKHAPNVLRCALSIEEIFEQAGCPSGVFQNLIIHQDKVKEIIENPVVKGVALTGGEKAGARVASIAGQNIKKTLLELGGSNAFIVSDDADIDKAVEIGVKARMMNSGQSCTAAKRFIVLEGVYESFLSKFVAAVKALKSGDPLHEDTQIGPLARVDLADQLNKQVQLSVAQGATIVVGGIQHGAYFAPTVMTDIQLAMPVFAEETFGPVAPIIKVKDLDEAIRIAEHTKYGLGISLFTKDIDKAKQYISKVSDGAFFINAMVKSDPRLPFGGTKYSGYGRELSKDGMLEFVNKKTVYIA